MWRNSAGDVARISRFRPFVRTPPAVIHREDLGGDKASTLTRAAVFLCKKLSAIGDLLEQDSDALTGLGPVARAPPLASQLSLARTKARSRAFFMWRGFSTHTVSPASVASVARVSTPEPGALLAVAALRGALDGDRGVRAPSAVDDLAGLRLAFIARLAARLHELHPGHAQATMATAFAGRQPSPCVLYSQPLKRSSAFWRGNKRRLSVVRAPEERLEGLVKALERHLRFRAAYTSRPHGEERCARHCAESPRDRRWRDQASRRCWSAALYSCWWSRKSPSSPRRRMETVRDLAVPGERHGIGSL